MEIKTKKDLFQWERNKKFFIENAPELSPLYAQIYNLKSACTPLIPIIDNCVYIPDEMLEQGLPITIAICTDEDVLLRKQFPIIKRPKPNGYNNT